MDTSEGRQASVFISYSREDKDFVRRLREALTKRDRETWVDLEDIRPTEEWLARVYSGIEGANAFIFIISSESVKSRSCLQELAHAVEHNKRLIPIVRREVDPPAVPEPLRSSQWIFFREEDDFEEAFQELVDALDTDLDWLHAHTRLLTRAIEWDNNGRDNSFVLRGSDLRTAEESQVRSTHKEPKLTALQTEYILAGRTAKTRRQRITLSAVIVGLVVAVVLGSLAWWQRNEAIAQRDEAERQTNIALARQLAAQSDLVRNQEPRQLERSVLLATESMQRHPSLEADQAVRGGLALLVSSTTRVSHASTVEDLAFSPDGERLATASADDTTRVWEVDTGREVLSVTLEDGVGDVDFSPDGKRLATSGGVDEARVWEVDTGREVLGVSHEASVQAVAFNPDGERLATASLDGTARVWDLDTGREVSRLTHEDEDFLTDVAFSPDGERLATGSQGETVHVWDLDAGREVLSVNREGGVADVAFSPNGEWLATGSWDDTARVWEVETGREVSRLTREEAVLGVAFSPDGEQLATASQGETVQVGPWQSESLVDQACSRLSRNLTRQEWQEYLGNEPYRKTCPNLSVPGG